jgi:DNA (cytosine-5)-methyltransferase 1
MRYLSVCSGIEAASVAWEPLGWEAVGFSEIEPFPCAVLAHHYPHVPLHGDFTALIENPPSCDVLVGGTPCTAFSVAGLRRSLDDARGNLTLAYVMLADAIDRRNLEEGKEPCITVWENVPGVFSTKDNAFGAFLGGLSGEDGPLEPPGGKWTHCGAVLGPTRAVCWRVQDAQYHGLAQRRQRVFVVASARNGFDPTQVLLEWEGVRRDSAPSRPARENPAAASGVSPAPRGGEHAGRGDGRVEVTDSLMCANGAPKPTLYLWQNNQYGLQQAEASAALRSSAGTSGFHEMNHPVVVQRSVVHEVSNGGGQLGVGSFPWPQDVTGALAARYGGQAMGAPEVDTGLYIPLPETEVVAPALTASNDPSRSPQSTEVTQQVTAVLEASQPRMVVRRLTPRECERLQGFPDDYTIVPWRGKPCPDGPRYKALGNSMAVPVMRWIGRRIDAHTSPGSPGKTHD